LHFEKKKIVQLVLLASLLEGLTTPLLAADEAELSLGERRQTALQAAREGRYDASLSTFVAMVKEAPNDIGIKADYITVLTWAKRDQAALDAAAGLDVKAIPSYCVNALAKAARNTAQFPLAIAYYQELINRDASAIDSVIGKTLTLSDAGKFAEAQTHLSKLRQQYPNNADVYRALSYLGQRSKQPVVVVDANIRLLEINNQDLDAARALITAARETGATKQAAALAAQYPKAADQNELNKINNDSAAQHIAWGHLATKVPAQRFADTDKALLKLNEACRCDWNGLDLSAGTPNTDKNRNLVFDRMLALRDRYRMQDVITHHWQLINAKIDPPAYVLNAVGDAYLYQRMPEEALAAYEASLVKVPTNIETKFSKFYALIELEQHEQATKLVDELSQNLVAYRNRPKSPVIRSEDAKLDADSKAYYVRAYGDDLETAEQHFQVLNNVGPMNSEVRMALGQIWRWRGWSERAEQRFYEASKDYPDQVSPRVSLANTHLDLRDWRLAESEIQPLVAEYPENSAVQALGKRWDLHNKHQLTMDGFSSKSAGSTFGSRTQGLNATLYSKPINYNYRAFVSTQYDHATFPEGTGRVLYPGVGLEYTNRDWRISGEISQASLSNIGVSTTLSADYRLDDYWSFASTLDINSSEMPLRGLRVGISGDMLSASAVYRWSDLTRAASGASYMKMEDSNQRQSLFLTLDRRLITKPHYKLTARARFDASHNSENNVSYYNPERDAEVGAILDNEWMLWRRYERSFGHRLQVGAGQYWQKNFGSSTSWILSYEQQFKWDNRFEIDYGISRSQHAYDGTDELSTQLFARLNLLF
jgi:biofilm PGA synthesis protein PgaA